MPDTSLMPLILKTGTVMRRDKEGCLDVRFEGHTRLVQLQEHQAAHIQVSEPSCQRERVLFIGTPSLVEDCYLGLAHNCHCGTMPSS